MTPGLKVIYLGILSKDWRAKWKWSKSRIIVQAKRMIANTVKE